MTTDKITRTTVTAQVHAAVEAQLLAVKEAIADSEGQLQELRATRSWLEGVLATADGAESLVPMAATGPLVAAAPPVDADGSGVAGEGVSLPSGQSPARRRPKAVSRPKSVALTLPSRVEAYLRESSGPQKIAEIADGLFGVNVVPANVNMTRSAAERLVQRGVVEKSKQGSTVYYEVASEQATAPAE